jgi:hypothetical protein
MRSLVLATAACSLCAACGSTMPSSPSGEVGPSTHVLTRVVQGTGGGKIQATGLADCSAPCTTNVAAGTQLTLVAVPDGASVFGGWSGDCHGSGECKVVLDADRSVAATFAKAPPPGKHVLTVVKTGSGTVTSSPAGIDCGSACSATFDDGATIVLTATPDSGCTAQRREGRSHVRGRAASAGGRVRRVGTRPRPATVDLAAAA